MNISESNLINCRVLNNFYCICISKILNINIDSFNAFICDGACSLSLYSCSRTVNSSCKKRHCVQYVQYDVTLICSPENNPQLFFYVFLSTNEKLTALVILIIRFFFHRHHFAHTSTSAQHIQPFSQLFKYLQTST